MIKLLQLMAVVLPLFIIGCGGGGGDDGANATVEEKSDDTGSENGNGNDQGNNDQGNGGDNGGDNGADNGTGQPSQFVHEGATIRSVCTACNGQGTPEENAIDGDDSTAFTANMVTFDRTAILTTRVDAAARVSFPAGTDVGARLFL